MAATMTNSEGGVAAVERALSILGAFEDGTSLTLQALAARTGLYKSTILRLIASLEKHRCITRLQDGRYQLGPALLQWGTAYQSSLRLDDHVLPVLQDLAAVTQEGASFFVRQGETRICLYRIDSPKRIREHIHAGEVLPLDRGAAGRIFLEFDPELAPPDRAARSPIIVTIGERESEIAAVAAPVFGVGGAMRGAIAVSGPETRFTKAAIKEISKAVLDAAITLTTRLGGDASMLEAHRGRR